MHFVQGFHFEMYTFENFFHSSLSENSAGNEGVQPYIMFDPNRKINGVKKENQVEQAGMS